MALDLHDRPRCGAWSTFQTCLHCYMTWLLGELSRLTAAVVAVWNPCSHLEHLKPGPAQARHSPCTA